MVCHKGEDGGVSKIKRQMYPNAHYRKMGCPNCLGVGAKTCAKCGGTTLMRDWFQSVDDPGKIFYVEGGGLKPMGTANKPKKGHPWIRSKQAIHDAKNRKT